MAYLIRRSGPLASPALKVYARLSPEGDRRLLARSELKAMCIDDILNRSRAQIHAPIGDAIAFLTNGVS